jgi:7,8-dihydropterin-6-yl-methyl-4-(beta-D-ribofuranosyl)aminobenzene 5'-phosphate synthase
MAKLGLPPSEIDAVVLSHPHFDHTGGLAALLAQNSDITVYGHTGFGDIFESALERKGASYVEVSSARTITASSGVTGPVGTGLTEQAFFVSTPEGLVVVTGCAHPGVVRMAQAAKEATGENIHLVLGGFHLGGASRNQLEQTAKELRELGVEKAAPCHCSGDACRRVFSKVFGDNYVANGTGRSIRIP